MCVTEHVCVCREMGIRSAAATSRVYPIIHPFYRHSCKCQAVLYTEMNQSHSCIVPEESHFTSGGGNHYGKLQQGLCLQEQRKNARG